MERVTLYIDRLRRRNVIFHFEDSTGIRDEVYMCLQVKEN
jgi:hypothetical protein